MCESILCNWQNVFHQPKTDCRLFCFTKKIFFFIFYKLNLDRIQNGTTKKCIFSANFFLCFVFILQVKISLRTTFNNSNLNQFLHIFYFLFLVLLCLLWNWFVSKNKAKTIHLSFKFKCNYFIWRNFVVAWLFLIYIFRYELRTFFFSLSMPRVVSFTFTIRMFLFIHLQTNWIYFGFHVEHPLQPKKSDDFSFICFPSDAVWCMQSNLWHKIFRLFYQFRWLCLSHIDVMHSLSVSFLDFLAFCWQKKKKILIFRIWDDRHTRARRVMMMMTTMRCEKKRTNNEHKIEIVEE